MTHHVLARRLATGGVAVLLLGLAPAIPAQAAPDSDSASSAFCSTPVPFRPRDFSRPLRIDNRFLPMRPGTQKTYRGYVVDAGERMPHTVVTTVTDLYKVTDGVRSRVILDVDLDSGEVAESELAFFAQDDGGRVWNTGEYPEEFEDGRFAGAPSTWISGSAHAMAGVHMRGAPLAAPHLGREYLQGRAPTIDFLDCAAVHSVEGTATVPAGTFTGVLTTFERSPLDSRTAIQTKEHAPGVGIVRIGARHDPEGEHLALTSVVTLDRAQLDRIDAQVRVMDRRGYRVSSVYRATGPLHRG
jgi:hypothetical protein